MIKKPVYDIFTDVQQMMMKYVVLYGVNLSNICIKHDGMALLSVVVNYQGEKKIEEVADLMYGEGPDEEDVMFLYPKDIEYLIPLIEAVHDAHPEFKLEVLSDTEEEAQDNKKENNIMEFGSKFEKPEFESIPVEDETTGTGDLMNYRYLKITTAPVTKKTRKLYLDAVDVLYQNFKTRIDAQQVSMNSRLAPKIAGYEKKDVDEVKRLADNIHETNIKNLNKVREDKEKEIEEGYQRYLERYSGEEEENEKDNSNANTDGGLFGQLTSTASNVSPGDMPDAGSMLKL